MSTTLKLSKDASGKSVDQTLYRGMIGSLLYLTASRHDISFSVGVCARYQSDPRRSHLSSTIVMRIEQEIVMIGRAHRWLLLSRQQLGVLVLQEAKLDFLVHGRGRVHSRGEWMHTTPMDETNAVDYGFNQGTLTLL
ncbi:hypothetical protein LWI29_019440 [Acer saccharum]|uniref:Uncharacterized protein n=1 Tax=Acer saccharum TaxID=4024 RepID=A0AA39VX98_ACESA|nr:hypothetical protein LWI29_019440 [Acer saccharum]